MSDTLELEATIEEAKAGIALANALDRLHQNKDFRLVMLKTFMEDEAIRLVHLKGHPNQVDAESQSIINTRIDSIGSVRNFFGSVQQQGKLFQNALEEAEAELEGIDLDAEEV